MNKVLLAVLAVVVSLTGCKRESKYASLRDNPVPAEIEVVSEGAGVVTNVYVGEILAKADIPLVFPLGGQLTSLQVKSGQKVREGQVIATVDNTQAKSMLESAEAMLNQAEDAWRRLKPVHENGGLSDVKWVEMETNLSKARSMVISSRKRYEDCTLRASQAGVVNLFDVEVGQHLNVGQPIGSLLDLSGKKASFTVPENEIGHLLHGDNLIVSLPALDLSFNATLDEKSLVATRLAHTYKVTVILDPKANTDILLPGMVCRIVTNSKNVEGYIISSSCVQTQQSGQSVWVLRNGRVERVPIRIGAFVENGVLVSEGLHVGDTVVSKGYQKMYKGARIQ
jgi:RND family efflux transporter MFP subunit